MAERLAGQYKLATSVGYQEYLKELGVGFFKRKWERISKPVLELTIEGEKLSLSYKSTFKNIESTFPLNVEFKNDAYDGREVKSLFSLTEDGKLVETQKATMEGDKNSVCVRYIKDQMLVEDLECNGIKCSRFYTRI